VLVRTEAEVLDGFTGVLGSTEEDDVGASGCSESQLVEGEALAAGLLDAGAGSGGEAKSDDAHLGDLIEAVVIGHGADNGSDLALR
jgi:hypothetical protein